METACLCLSSVSPERKTGPRGLGRGGELGGKRVVGGSGQVKPENDPGSRGHPGRGLRVCSA